MTSTTSTSPSSARRPARRQDRRPTAARPDPCAIEGGYAHVAATTLAAVWTALNDGRLRVADVRTWCALVSVEAGLRASVQSGRRRDAVPATIDQVARAYWTDRPAAVHDRRVLRQRLTRLAAAKLVGDVSDDGDIAGRQKWATLPGDLTDASQALLDGFGCPAGRTLRLPRRWLATFARELTAGTFAAAVASTFMCGWGRGAATGGGVDRPVWSGRVSASRGAKVLGLPSRTLRAGLATLQQAGQLESMSDRAWAARRWGRRVRVRPGPPVNRPADRSIRGARRPAAETPASARRTAAPDQTQTRLRRNQTPRPATSPDAGALRGGVYRAEVRTQVRKSKPTRRPNTRRADRHRDPWQEANLASPEHVGRLYRRLVETGAIGEGPCDAVRFFAAAVRAREVSRRPVALLRWLVSNRRWEFITDGQDERGHREWKAWQRRCEDGRDAGWGEDGDHVRDSSHRKSSSRGDRPFTTTEVRPRNHADAPAVASRRTPASTPPSPKAVPGDGGVDDPMTPGSGEVTVDQWPADVRVLVGQVAIGRARGWDLPSIRGRLSRRDGWTALRVIAAEAEARQRGLLNDA